MSGRQRLGHVDEFDQGKITTRELDGRSVGVFRDGDAFYGMLNLCPHRAAPVCQGIITGTMLPSDPGEVVYGLDGLVLRCPWHGWEFDVRDGTSIGPVDRRNLTMFAVERDGDELFGSLKRGTRQDPAEAATDDDEETSSVGVRDR